MRAKVPQKPNFESKKIRILGENGINSKLKHRKLAHKLILSWKFGDPYGRPGDCCRIRESWHVCMIHCLNNLDRVFFFRSVVKQRGLHSPFNDQVNDS